jgi:hypothetical protein
VLLVELDDSLLVEVDVDVLSDSVLVDDELLLLELDELDPAAVPISPPSSLALNSSM